MPMLRQKWDDLYEAAVFELNPTTLLVRIDLARKAIQSRLTELDGKDGMPPKNGDLWMRPGCSKCYSKLRPRAAAETYLFFDCFLIMSILR